MKIERISESQVKFLLNKNDLEERNIKMHELAYGSEKMNDLIREMIEQAVIECGFEHAEGTVPMMIEAVPISSESIMLIITKVNEPEEFDINLNLFPKAKDERKFVKKPLINNTGNLNNPDISLYVFNSLENLTVACKRISKVFCGKSDTFIKDSNYYLLLYSDTIDQTLTSILSEYGNMERASKLTDCYLSEHGEPLILNNAVAILNQIS